MYLLHTTSFVTLEEVRNIKSISSYKSLAAGWVLDVESGKHDKSDCTLVVGKVCHSYSNKTPIRPWQIIESIKWIRCVWSLHRHGRTRPNLF